MKESFAAIDLQDAQSYLKGFSEPRRRKGLALFRHGAVKNLTEIEAGMEYSADVYDKEDEQVNLFYDLEEGWMGDCTCPEEVECEHVYAAMSALLAEHRTFLVRQLSSNAGGSTGGLTVLKKPGAEPVETESLADKLKAAAGRALTKEETKFLKALHQLYLRCRQSRQITSWDFQQLGFMLMEFGWGPLKIWPSFPENEHEFWLYMANALLERNLKVPAFMRPITDLEPIQDRLARWRRAREIEQWKQTLSHLQVDAPMQRGTVVGEVDLQVVIDAHEVSLQWRPPGESAFKPLKQTPLRQLADNIDLGLVQFTPEGEVIWQLFSQSGYYRIKADLRYLDAHTTRMLNRFLRMRMLESRIVNVQGQPLVRVAEPLRWNLTPAVDAEDDYRLRLVQANGEAPPPFVCVLPGQPTLYVTTNAVYTGPDPRTHVLESTKENRIPAPALERTAGVSFLQSLDLDLPPRLRERVRTLPYQVAITCALRPTFQGSDAEECVVQVQAEAPDGRRQTWTGDTWIESKKGSQKQQDKNAIVVYDSSALAVVPGLMAPLNLKRPYYNNTGLTMRVTKKFPEIFADWLKTVPPQITVHLQGDLASFQNTDVAGHVKLEVSEAEIDWFDLRVVLNVADTTLTQEEIKLLLNAKGGYVRLKGKGWRRLQFDLSEEEDDRLARLGLSPRELSAEPQRLHALQLADEAARKFLPEQQVEQIQRRAGEIKARVAPDLPAGVIAQMRPYQLEGFHFLAYLATNRFGGILADDMGLGKTLQTLAWLIWLREQKTDPTKPEANGPQIPPSLVVCPKSVMDNWHAESTRFAPGLRVKSWPAGELGAFRSHLGEADVHVINYSQLRSLGESLVSVKWLSLILDEGQYIKNPNSQTAQVARSLKAEHRLILSGTPIENRLLDLWSLMAFAMPGVLGSRAQFAKLYDAKDDPFARRRLAARVRPFVLRRTKAQVAKDLPDRIEEDLFCEIEGEQKTLYRAELKRAQQLLLRIKTQKELAQHQFHFLTSLLRLRQICCHPRLMKPDSTGSSAKTESLLEQLEPVMEEGEKVLVFSQFVEMLDLLRPALEERKWPVFYLAGQTENRGELVRQFQAAEGPAVFLISLKAGGFGLNLTAANYVVLFDPWWNPAVENQAIDRTHRIGQTNKVIAYRLLIKDSIEEKIRELQKSKKALAEDVLGEEKFAQSLTLDDLQFLFAD
ncbi:MAG TPA: DEAD/DEAH box helicase [Clostridia bacterium]|nr:DEAD/DEAH box helicase [Clostridia bacterium]